MLIRFKDGTVVVIPLESLIRFSASQAKLVSIRRLKLQGRCCGNVHIEHKTIS
jgi:hypothetical protein